MTPDSVVELRVRGAQEAATRARWAFLVTIIACGTILVALYNTYFAWDRMLLDKNRGLIQPILTAPCLPSNFKEPAMPKLSAEKASEWIEAMKGEKAQVCKTVGELQTESNKEDAKHVSDNNSINLSWLGISLGSADLDVFGSLALYVACAYYLLCMRRLSRDVCSLLVESQEAEADERRYIYFGVRQALVLNPDADDADPPGRSEAFVRGLVSFNVLKFLPVTVVACMLASDGWYLHTISYEGGWWGWWQNLQPAFKIQLVLGSSAALLVGLAIFVLNKKALTFDNDITNAMRKFASNLPGD